jgi:molecular chaperone HscB
MDYFNLLGLTPQFFIDPAQLESAYFAAQRLSHPDRFVGKSEVERQAAMQRSVDINQAYHTLKDELKRAQYLLHLKGIEVGTEHDSVKPSGPLLMEAMEWRERADEAGNVENLDDLEDLLKDMQEQSIAIISDSYKTEMLDVMAQETLRLNYLMKIREGIAKHKRRLKKAS